MHVLFLLNLISLGPDNWSAIVTPEGAFDPMTGVAISFYAALAFLCLFAIRFPLKFTPLLLIQLFYKLAWLLGTYLPAKNTNSMDESLESWFWVMTIDVLIDLLVIPWGICLSRVFKRLLSVKSICDIVGISRHINEYQCEEFNLILAY